MEITLLILTAINGISSHFINEEIEVNGIAKVTQSLGSIHDVLTLRFPFKRIFLCLQKIDNFKYEK